MNPFIRASAMSGTLFTTGDVLCQKLVPDKVEKPVDWTRAGKFGLGGALIHGPWFLQGFRVVDRIFGTQPTLPNAVRKALFAQVTLFPAFLVLFLGFQSVLDGNSPTVRIRDDFTRVFTTGTAVWPLANVMGFRFVPATYRIPYINMVALGWNTYLSSVNDASAREEAAALG
ncbi:hypothetical protein HKX48_001508 [Thoreauomyces humboldtii]|nr:hypothetical protein HKX48_001508 [Thoreauomyces humboldtii]